MRQAELEKTMSAAAAKLEINHRGISRDISEVINGDTVFHKALAALHTFDHGTSGNIERQGPYAKTAGQLLAGYTDVPHQVAQAGGSAVSVLGDTGASPPPTAGIAMDDTVYEGVAVTGVTARTDFGRPVYCSTDNGKTDFTLTRPAAPAEAVGIVWKFRASAVADVLVFGLRTRLAMQRPGYAENVSLGHLDFSTVADGNNIVGFPMPFKGRIIGFFGVVREENVGSGGTILLNLEIDTVDVTGGVLTWSTAEANVRGEVLQATAISATNIVHEGSVVDVEGANAGGTRTSGIIELYAKVERLAGL